MIGSLGKFLQDFNFFQMTPIASQARVYIKQLLKNTKTLRADLKS